MKSKHPLYYLIPLLFSCLFWACENPTSDSKASPFPSFKKMPPNPAIPGFNEAASDEKAIKIADKVMNAMGGRTNWDETRYIQWTMYDVRTLLWDRQNQMVRIDAELDSAVFFLDIKSGQGRFSKRGTEYDHPDSLSKYLPRAKDYFTNDSYWLLMPFLLKDKNATLKYLREDSLGGKKADVLQVSYDPPKKMLANKYEVYVEQSSKLVTQWAYYHELSDTLPVDYWLWDNYKKYGKILLSAERTDSIGPSNVAVFDSIPTKYFDSMEPM